MLFSRLVSQRLAILAQQQPALAFPSRLSASVSLLHRLLKPADAFASCRSSCALSRSYATAGRPKKSTRKTGKTSRASPKSKPKAKKKPAKKQRSKTKTTSRKKTKKEKTESQILSAKVASLRKIALLGVPKTRPETVWRLCLASNLHKGETATIQTKQISRRYQNLGASERESLNQTAINNRLLNQRDYADWIRSHTPDQIRLANNARTRLNRLSAQRHSTTNYRYTKRFNLLKDERQLKRPKSAYMQYMADRWATGEFRSQNARDVARQLAREWKQLNDGDRRKYLDEAYQRKEHYFTERAELYPSIAERPQRRGRSTSAETLGR